MKTKIILFVLLLNTLLFCNSRQTEEFYIEIPSNWIQIPRQAVDFLIKELDHPSAIDTKHEKYSYLYQQKSEDTLFSLPHILIQVNSTRRLSKSELLDNKYMKFDGKNNYLWSEGDSTVNVIIPTEKGTINIYCVSDLQTSKQNKPLFKNIIKSIVVSYDLVYKDDFIHNTPILRDFATKANSQTMLFIAIIAALIFTRFFRRKTAAQK